MKKKILALMIGFLLIGVNLYAGDGDLIVEGNVGIGTTEPKTKLHLSGECGTGMYFSDMSVGTDKKHWYLASCEGNLAFQSRDDNYGLQRINLRLNRNGVVAIAPWRDAKAIIGSGVPDEKLDVIGNVKANDYLLTSDMKFKKDITSINSPLNKIMEIQGVSYKWKTEEYKDKGFKKGKHYGVIAQEIEKVIPGIVKENLDGEKRVSYVQIIPVLIEAVKEQQKIIEQLKEKVQQLETKDFMAKFLWETD